MPCQAPGISHHPCPINHTHNNNGHNKVWLAATGIWNFGTEHKGWLLHAPAAPGPHLWARTQSAAPTGWPMVQELVCIMAWGVKVAWWGIGRHPCIVLKGWCGRHQAWRGELRWSSRVGTVTVHQWPGQHAHHQQLTIWNSKTATPNWGMKKV